MDDAAAKSTSTPSSAEHLCVLVHGLWGNPEHLKNLSAALRERYAEDKLHIFIPKRNAGSFTYDGIELGGERVAHEIEEHLEELNKNGNNIKKISVIGYSLGGLISRYAIGLLYHRGLFDKIQPINFTTFATPHLGVRTPLLGTHNHVWNVLGARTLSMSGRQLFTIDTFRDTGKPLLAVLADPTSIFIRALAAFKHRSLYANVVNDRTVTYYTAGISQTDPFAKMDDLDINYVKGYEPVIVDGDDPFTIKKRDVAPAFPQRLSQNTRNFFGQIPFAVFLMVFLPIGSTVFLVNSAIQSVRSRQRIKLHEEGKAGVDFGGYRIPLLNKVRGEVEDLFENINNTHEQEYLPNGSETMTSPTQSPKITRTHSMPKTTSPPSDNDSDKDSLAEQKRDKKPEIPTLALTPDQFAMVEALDNVGFQKHPVYIHNVRHSHAAIIRRMNRSAFHEGFIVFRHWLDNFQL
ncbi:lipase/serine esteras-like protein [Aaosphaeria arxii CBS 175.79]|uniref:Lipase/serine esteras-like protein n=1 Tax=Aaosphaeria arxii CBS 175.79 TaxID=1450172 RepID=A0A6A5XNV0_9PLEO|nr:lipase/serine esteras-like protein [Aaosphaeria arxii CBS 175.79]KAF2014935.1 lipase/serine esteras-like protein [Aaosphaeria arxii CBS 175.79]